MTKRKSRIIGFVMLIVAVVFAGYAMGHPELSFPWSDTVTNLMYGMYGFMTAMFLIAPAKNPR